MKYRLNFPDQVLSLEHGRGFCGDYFDWYNNDHHHSGLGFLTPAHVHYGLAGDVLSQRQAVLERAHATHRDASRAVCPPSLRRHQQFGSTRRSTSSLLPPQRSSEAS